jgi:RNA polymerase sigma factor (sigma-70 family)
MASGQLGPFTRHLLGMVAGPGNGALTDSQLLERFVRTRDEAAFETLLWRHGPMVLGLCQRILRRSHDAEDAFQATFIVLFKKAGSIDKHDALGSWLYKCAYRIALKAKAQESDRRQREALTPPGERWERDADLVWRDLRPVLDAELNHLPEKYRSPLVLCYLEGKTQEQAARELQWPAGTVAGRLARGKELLRSRLTRRGLTLMLAGFAGTLAHAQAGVVPKVLVLSTLTSAKLFSSGKAAAVSPNAVGLARTFLNALLVTRIKLVAAAMLAASVVAGGATVAVCRVLASQKTDFTQKNDPNPDKGPSKPPEQGPRGSATKEASIKLSARGTVVDEGGLPVPGANVYLREWLWIRTNYDKPKGAFKDVLAQCATDEQGRFAFKDIKVKSYTNPLGPKFTFPWDLVVVAKNYGTTGERLTFENQRRSLTLLLRPERKLHGRVLDPAGKPLSGGRVVVERLGPLQLNWSELQPTTRTDADGKFQFSGLAKNESLTLDVDDERFVPAFEVKNTDQSQPNRPFPTVDFDNQTVEKQIPVYTGAFTVTLQPGHRLSGRVLFDDSSHAAAGASVQLWHNLQQAPSTKADAAGRFSFSRLPPGKYLLAASPADNVEFRNTATWIEIAGARSEVEHDVRLQRGLVVCGQIVDEITGEGVWGATIVHESDSQEITARVTGAARSHSLADGRFRIALPPGTGRLRVETAQGYLVPDLFFQTGMKEYGRLSRSIVLSPERIPSDLKFSLSRGFVLAGSVVDSQRKPVAGAQVWRMDEQSGYSNSPSGPLITDAQGQFTIAGLSKEEDYPVSVTHPGRKLAATLTVRAPRDQTRPLPVQVNLEPACSLAGRAVDDEAKPIAGATVVVSTVIETDGGHRRTIGQVAGPLIPDATGRFTFDCLLPKQHYQLAVLAEGHASNPSIDYSGARSGEMLQIEDVIAPRLDQILRGQVVDKTGKPVSGIVVGYTRLLLRGGATTHIGGPYLPVDKSGRFQFDQVPRGLVEVWAALLPKPGESAFRTLASMELKEGKQDIHLVVELP